jgi:hypothetical protein
MIPMTKLENGAMLIAIKEVKEKSDTGTGFWIVLAYTGGHDPYVTWVMNDRGHCFSGNYFRDIVAAAKDYGERN